jgi:glycosyltransferase involved in cell wall biosynthesis
MPHSKSNAPCSLLSAISYSNPCLSVIMSVYNAEQYVSDCIESILGQTFPDFEFIIINDASTDNSLEIIKSFKDMRIRLIMNHKRIYTSTRNKGLRVAKGKYICIMDADDISLPTRFERQVLFMEQNTEYGLAGSGYRVLGKEQDLFRESDYEKIKVDLIRNNCFIHPSVIIRHELLKKYNLRYRKRYIYSSDYDLIARAARCFPITNIYEVLMYYRVHQGQITMQHRSKQAELADEIAIDQLRYIGIDPDSAESSLHTKLLKNIPIEYAQKQMLLKWIDKILQANQKMKYYDEEELKSFFNSLLSLQPFCNLREKINLATFPNGKGIKYDLRDVTFVFPIRIESQERIENINSILSFITRYFNTNIRILESDNEQHYFDYEFYSNVNYIFIEDTDDIFQRTELRNRLISEANTPFVAVFDTDAIALPEQIINAVNILRGSEVVMSLPFDGRYYLCDAVLSKIFIKTQDINVLIKSQTDLRLMNGYHCVGGAFIVDKDRYLKAGGENEDIRGWGCEDQERIKRMEVLNLVIHYSTGPLFHLWHPRGKNNYFSNQKIRQLNIIELLKTCKR